MGVGFKDKYPPPFWIDRCEKNHGLTYFRPKLCWSMLVFLLFWFGLYLSTRFSIDFRKGTNFIHLKENNSEENNGLLWFILLLILIFAHIPIKSINICDCDFFIRRWIESMNDNTAKTFHYISISISIFISILVIAYHYNIND